MKLVVALVLTVLSFTAFSQTRIISVDAFDLSYVGGLSFKHEEGRHEDQDTTTFKLNLNYAQAIEEYVGLMWKGQVYWNRVDSDFGSADRLVSEFGVAGGFLYNFQAENIKNSFMTSALIGMERGAYELDGGDDEAGLNLFVTLEGGKRFDLGSYSVANISYAPTISLTLKRYGGDARDEYFESSREIRFNFLKFDVLF